MDTIPMKKLTIITAACCLGTFGCRMTDAPFQSDSLTARYERQESSAPSTANLSRLPSPAQEVAPASHVLPVAYQPEPESLPMEPQSIEPVQAPQAVDTESEGLSLLDFEGMALQNNPALGQMANLIDAAQGNWLQVGLVPNPSVGYSGQQLGSRGLAEQQGVFMRQDFITGKKLRLNREVAGWEIQRVEQEFETTRYRVLTDVRIAYYDALIAQRRRDLSEELASISDKAVAAAQALFQGEEVSEADPLRARVEADSARIVLQNATNQQQEAWRQLAATVGMPELMLTHVEGTLEPEGMDASWDETLQQILTDSPEMAAAMALVESAQWAIDRAHAEVIPNVRVQGVFQDDRGTGSTNGNMMVILPIPFLNRNQGGIQQAHAEAVAAELAVDRLALDLQSRLASVYQRYLSAQNQVQQYSREGGILENAERTLELIRAGYQAEEFSVLDMLTAQRTYFQTNLAYLDSLRELWAADMEIRGQLLTGSLAK
jgi:outer membrane protein, heavy metal efflux system